MQMYYSKNSKTQSLYSWAATYPALSTLHYGNSSSPNSTLNVVNNSKTKQDRATVTIKYQ